MDTLCEPVPAALQQEQTGTNPSRKPLPAAREKAYSIG
jgi:hypothetical protein